VSSGLIGRLGKRTGLQSRRGCKHIENKSGFTQVIKGGIMWVSWPGPHSGAARTAYRRRVIIVVAVPALRPSEPPVVVLTPLVLFVPTVIVRGVYC
jgi:hypothetical protein